MVEEAVQFGAIPSAARGGFLEDAFASGVFEGGVLGRGVLVASQVRVCGLRRMPTSTRPK